MLQWLDIDFAYVEICEKSKQNNSHVLREILHEYSR